MNVTNHEQWLCEFREMGGYDCMTGSFAITRDGNIIAEVDLRLFGQDPCKEATQEQLRESHRVAKLITAAPDMLAALKGDGRDPSTPDFLDWLADRLVYVYREPDSIDFVKGLRMRAASIRSAIAKAEGMAE